MDNSPGVAARLTDALACADSRLAGAPGEG